MENWQNIRDFETLYDVSDIGEVKSLDRIISDNFNGDRIHKGRILKQADNGKGYKIVSLWKDGKGNMKYVHRLVAEAFLDNPDKLPEVNHKDGIKSNNHSSNLEWSTGGTNMEHSYANNLHKSGQQHCNSIFNDDIALIIKKELLTTDNTINYYINKYNVSQGTINNISNNNGRFKNINEKLEIPEQWINITDDLLLSNYGRVKEYNINFKEWRLKSFYKCCNYKQIKYKNEFIVVHRLVINYFVQVNNYDIFPNIIHLDGNICNNRFDNLKYYTDELIDEGIIDFILNIEPIHKNNKSNNIINDVKLLLDDNITQHEIAKRLNVSQSLISNIKKTIK